MPKSGGHTDTWFMYLRKRTNINELYLDIWLFTNSHLCQFIEIVHKIINCDRKMPNNYLSVLYKLIIKVANENVGLKVCVCVGYKHTIAPHQKSVCVCVGGGGGGTCTYPCMNAWMYGVSKSAFVHKICSDYILFYYLDRRNNKFVGKWFFHFYLLSTCNQDSSG